MRDNRLVWAYALLASCVVFLTASAKAAPQVGHPAIWRPHDLIVNLHELPTRYTCDDLWYKFRDVLLALGARSDMRILVYRCADPGGAPAFSPSVHLQFFTPAIVKGDQARWAQIDAVSETISLSPGRPASLRDSDCELMRQMKDGLLPALTQRVLSVDLACASPRPSRWPFNITVQALTPVNANSHVAARVDAFPRGTLAASED